MTPGEDRVAVLDVEQVELFAAKETNKNPQQWVIKKRESQVGELDQLKLKVVLHDGIDKETYMTQSIEFVAADLVSVD